MTSPTSGFTVSDYLIVRLAELGLRDIFAVPGDYVAGWLDHVDDKDRRPARLNRYGCCNELEAGYAADAYARLRGIGCVAVTYGVGAFSLVNAVAGAYVERLPVIVINGSPGNTSSDRLAAREYSILLHHATGDYHSNYNAYKDITTHATILSSAEEAPAQIDKALAAAMARKRPVYIEVWRNLWNTECTPPSEPLKIEPLPCNENAVRAAAAEAAARLSKAAKPMLWAGIELQRFGLQQAFAGLRDQLRVPYVTSLLAKSVLSEEHAGFVGTYTGCASDYTTYTAVDEAEMLLVAGDLLTDDYTSAVEKAYARMIVAYDNTVRIGSATYTDVPLGRFLEELKKACAERQTSCGKPWISRSEQGTAAPARGKAEPMTYERFFRRIGTWVDADMTLLPDESTSMYVSCNLHVRHENGFVAQAAWGSIGYAAPAGFGLAVADPRRRSVVFIGDGGFQMTAQTLGSMACYRLNPVVFVMDNGIYGIEQALTNSEVYTNQGEQEPFDAYNVLPRWDYVRLAEALGVQGRTVATVGELDAVLDEVKATPKSPFLVQVLIPERDMPAEIIRLAKNEVPSAP